MAKSLSLASFMNFYFFASSALWKFANFIATLLLYYCCYIFFHLHCIFFLLSLPMLTFFHCLTLCKCQWFVVNWSLFKAILDIHMVSGGFFFLHVVDGNGVHCP